MKILKDHQITKTEIEFQEKLALRLNELETKQRKKKIKKLSIEAFMKKRK